LSTNIVPARGGDLEGRVALVTGAVRRIGRATALALAGDGAAVVINARRSRDEAEAVAAEITARGGQALVSPTGLQTAPQGIYNNQ
jgi:3-oxoacyl-[acyl-carrier protein] reductase